MNPNYVFKVGDTVTMTDSTVNATSDLTRGKAYRVFRTRYDGYDIWIHDDACDERGFNASRVLRVGPAISEVDLLKAKLKEAKAAEAAQKAKAAKRAKELASLTKPQRDLVIFLDSKTTAFGCNRNDVIAVLSAVVGKDLKALLK